MSFLSRNQTTDRSPIVLHALIIKGIKNVSDAYELEIDLRSKFAPYGKIWSFDIDAKTLKIEIGFDNEKSRNLAVQKETGSYISGGMLKLEPCYGELMNATNISKQKLNNPETDINTLMKCKNYWNKDLYPPNIVQQALENDTNAIYRGIFMHYQTEHRGIFIQCYHNDIKYPFLIHMASENRTKQHIIHIRPQSVVEIARMLWEPNILLLRNILPHNYAFGVDWRYYKFCPLRERTLLSSYMHEDPAPYECIKYMINVIKCNINAPIYESLHVAAMRHDINLINLLLNFGVNPLQKSADKFRENALAKCNWRWRLYQEQQQKMNDDIKHYNESDGKVKNDNHIYIRSIYLSKLLCIGNYGNMIYFSNVSNVGTSCKEYAQFLLECVSVEDNSYIIKVKFGSLSFKRICSMQPFDKKSDLALTANITDKSVSFLPYTNSKQQNWFIDKQVIGNEEGIKICCVDVDDVNKYELYATNNHQIKLKQIIDDEKQEEEGRDLDTTLESLFVILNKFRVYKFEFATGGSNWLNYKSELHGDIEKCRRIHQNIVDKLQQAMKIEKLYGHTMKSDVKENDETHSKNCKKKKYKPPKIIHRFGDYAKQQQKYDRFGRRHQQNYKTSREKGIFARYNVSKGFGFIRMDNGGDIFVHRTEIKAKGFQYCVSLFEGENVEFDVVVQHDGRRQAVNVTKCTTEF